MKVKVAQLCPTLCDPMEFSRPEYWNGQPFPSPGDLPNPGIKPKSPALQVDSLPAEPQGKPIVSNSNQIISQVGTVFDFPQVETVFLLPQESESNAINNLQPSDLFCFQVYYKTDLLFRIVTRFCQKFILRGLTFFLTNLYMFNIVMVTHNLKLFHMNVLYKCILLTFVQNA